ncbi:TPA: hypothetical protein ACGDWM_003480, partial [Acinetobacter baumannii]
MAGIVGIGMGGMFMQEYATKDSLNTLKKLVVEKEIKDYVASNYPIESLEIDLLSSEIYDNCMDV